MNDAGSNQPMPLVHNGIMYLGNTGNMMQALDAATGDLIWENQVGPNSVRGSLRACATPRSTATTSSWRPMTAACVAFDARTGKVAWDVPIADPKLGFTNSSGPIVVNGKVIQGLHGCDRFRAEGSLHHQRLRCGDRQAVVEVQHHRAHRRDRRRYVGQRCPTSRAPAAIPGSPAATIPISI